MFVPIYKAWGHTYRLPMPSGSEVHVAYMKKGGKSSMHRHDRAVNGFFVIEGSIRITQEQGEITRQDNVEAGGFIAVETNTLHGFEALEDSIVVEVYGSVDIQRERIPT